MSPPAPSNKHPIQTTVQSSYDQIADQYLAWTESRPSPRIRYIEKMLTQLQIPLDANSAAVSTNNPNVSAGLQVLELGCGAGVPVSAYLASHVGAGGGVVANDISSAQVKLARERLRDAENVDFVEGDMLDLRFEDGKFAGVVAFFSLFHLPVMEQATMLERVFGWMRRAGCLVCNFGAESSEALPSRFPRPATSTEEVEEPASGGESVGEEKRDGGEPDWGSFFGAQMFWANRGTEGSLEMIRGAGFEVVEWDVLDGLDEEEGQIDEDEPDRGVKFLWVVARKV